MKERLPAPKEMLRRAATPLAAITLGLLATACGVGGDSDPEFEVPVVGTESAIPTEEDRLMGYIGCNGQTYFESLEVSPSTGAFEVEPAITGPVLDDFVSDNIVRPALEIIANSEAFTSDPRFINHYARNPGMCDVASQALTNDAVALVATFEQ